MPNRAAASCIAAITSSLLMAFSKREGNLGVWGPEPARFRRSSLADAYVRVSEDVSYYRDLLRYLMGIPAWVMKILRS
jgi:hypothetical protein